MLARPQHLDRERAVVHGTGGEEDRVDVVTGEQLGVAAVRDSEPPPYLLRPPLARCGDRHQLGLGQPLDVFGMQGSHPAEAGDAKPKRTRRP